MQSAYRMYMITRVLFIIGVIIPVGVVATQKEDPAKELSSDNNKQLTKEDQKTLGKVLRDLVRSGDENSFAAITQYALDQSPDIRQQAALALGWSKHKKALKLLITLAHDENKNVRGAAMLGLGWHNDPEAFHTIVEAVEKDESIEVKRRAVLALGQMRNDKALDKLLECMNSTSTVLRRSAAMALGRAENTRVIEPLITALCDPEDEVRKCAAMSLKNLTGQDALYKANLNKSRDEAQRTWQGWWGNNKDTFQIAKQEIGSSSIAREWIKEYDTNKDGSLNELELQTALDNVSSIRPRIKTGDAVIANIAVKNLDGSEAMLSAFLKGPTVIYYFFSACPRCAEAESFIGKLAEANKDGKIAFLGIAASRDKLQGLNKYVGRTKWGFPVVFDEKKEFAGKNHIGGTPVLFIIDSSGNVIELYRGLPEAKREAIAKRIAELAQSAS